WNNLGLVGASFDLDELVADETVGLDRGDGIDANQRMEVFTDPQLHAEPRRGLGRDLDAINLSRIHAAHADLRAVLEPRDIRELRVDIEGAVEEHAAVADQEEAGAEEQHSGNQEGA